MFYKAICSALNKDSIEHSQTNTNKSPAQPARHEMIIGLDNRGLLTRYSNRDFYQGDSQDTKLYQSTVRSGAMQYVDVTKMSSS